MSEVRVAYFRHRYEADMARGFLDDADTPCRLISDNAAGGVAYVGGLAGAWILVGEANAEAAVDVLESAGMLTTLETPAGPAAERQLRLRSNTPQRPRRRLRRVVIRQRRHRLADVVRGGVSLIASQFPSAMATLRRSPA